MNDAKTLGAGRKTFVPVPWYRYVAGVALGLAAIWAVFWVFGWMMRPVAESAPPELSAEEMRALEASRDVTFSAEDRYSLHVAVPDSDRERVRLFLDREDRPVRAEHIREAVNAGRLPAWFPRGEAPVLTPLVEDGVFPPVHERVGPEPVVLRGLDGIGRYGGTWTRIANSAYDVRFIGSRLAGATLVRWSPLGYPIEPHLALRVEQRDEGRVYQIRLRQGLRWSDGHPVRASDLMYWWEHEVHSPAFHGAPPAWLTLGGEAAQIRQVDDYTVRIEYPEPYALFEEMLMTGSFGMLQPEHYLRPFHPELGDPAFLRERMDAYGLGSPQTLYQHMKDTLNPEHPRLWPWIPRRHTNTPPYVFVRNPYYYVVDEQGNQLPYIDRVQFDVQDGRLLPIAAADGRVSMQKRHIKFENYTELMARSEGAGTRILLWYPLGRSSYLISPNVNRRIDPDDPATRWKADFLADRRFRQALSLAIDRAAIVRAEYHGLTEPSQLAPGPASEFHQPALSAAFIEHDPERAEALLDELWAERGADPTLRDAEGFRVFPDGTRVVFFFDVCDYTGPGPAELILDDWAGVGVRVILRTRSRTLFYTDKAARNFDFNVWAGSSDHFPIVSPRNYVAFNRESNFAMGWAIWYEAGGLYGHPRADTLSGAIPVPEDHPMRRAMEAYERAIRTTHREAQRREFGVIAAIAAENVWTLNLSTAPPLPVVVSRDLRNVPPLAVEAMLVACPANAGIETYFFVSPPEAPGLDADTRRQLREPGMLPTYGGRTAERSAWSAGRLVQAGLGIVGLLFLGALTLRHPFVGRRLLIMVPTLLVISVCAFVIIQLPPGDFLTARIIQLQEGGATPEEIEQRVEELRTLYHFDEPGWQRYLRWMGVRWFRTFDAADRGLLQGQMGRSMETGLSVNAMIGDRLLLTFLISLGTILFTWAVAIPIGIYSAVRQHSIGDYVITFIGFLGMCIPPFLLALILMTLANVSGLFSPEYAIQPYWTWGKVLDLLRHIWIPIAVMGIGGTAGMIRVMRANLLDELRKPYVVTARAKGVRPVRLLLKYPVRIALNPFVSGIGGLFPQLVSGGAIVAIVLSLPTVGPLMLGALFSQDMNLAGSMLMLLSLLSVAGTLVSDLLLLWLDPRIRMEGGGSR